MPVELRRRILARQLVRQGNWHLVLLVAPPNRLRRLDLLAQVLQGIEHGMATTRSLPPLCADGQLRGLKVDVLDPQVERLAHAQAATVEQPHCQAGGKSGVALDGLEQQPGFRRRRGVANPGWPSGPQRLDVFQLRAQGFFVEKDNCIKSLFLILVLAATSFWAKAVRNRSSLCSLGKCNGSPFRKSQYSLSQAQ